MGMDYLRSFGYCRARLTEGSEETWVRWYPCAPGAKLFPAFHAFGHAVWEDEREEFDGPGMIGLFRQWAPTRYPAPPGDHFHGELSWFQDGLPVSELTSPTLPPDPACTPPSPVGGVVCGGTAFHREPTDTCSLLVDAFDQTDGIAFCQQWFPPGFIHVPIVTDPVWGSLTMFFDGLRWKVITPDGHDTWTWSQLGQPCGLNFVNSAGTLRFQQLGFPTIVGECVYSEYATFTGMWKWPTSSPTGRLFGHTTTLVHQNP
jgi:hypothetical protein